MSKFGSMGGGAQAVAPQPRTGGSAEPGLKSIFGGALQQIQNRIPAAPPASPAQQMNFGNNPIGLKFQELFARLQRPPQQAQPPQMQMPPGGLQELIDSMFGNRR